MDTAVFQNKIPLTADTVASCRYGHLIQQRSPATVTATFAAEMCCPPSDSWRGCIREHPCSEYLDSLPRKPVDLQCNVLQH